MKYESPVKRTKDEILELLSSQSTKPDERIKAVLSALYYTDTIEFAGDLLIKEFSEANYPEKYWLKNLFQTFYGMCRTDYKVADSIALLEKYKEEVPNHIPEINEDILALREYAEIFARKHNSQS